MGQIKETSLLGFGLRFSDLFDDRELAQVDRAFLSWLGDGDPDMRERLESARLSAGSASHREEADLLLALSPFVDSFVGELFGISDEIGAAGNRQSDLECVYTVKRLFVQRRALKDIDPDSAASLDGRRLAALLEERIGAPVDEIGFARAVSNWLQDPNEHEQSLSLAKQFAAWACHAESVGGDFSTWVMFRRPKRTDAAHLIEHLRVDPSASPPQYSLAPSHRRERDGFGLTDEGPSLAQALDETHYCIWCHEQSRDECSTGARVKKRGQADAADLPFKSNTLGVELTGCPLEERISEFQKAKSTGLVVSPLAIIMIDNPMVAATGHRICNDCTKSCIYQKQTPVDIPKAESRTLKDVLELTYGFEILNLLGRWNPMNFARPLPCAATGKRILVVGMGPAGFTLAHHLLNDGHTVVGVDGLKIEPMAEGHAGTDCFSSDAIKPVKQVETLYEDLDNRLNAGFGGVAEYGITVRWNKNFLKLIRLMLQRRARFEMFGGVRFGGTLDVDDAWRMGFDHIALAMGAGRPTVINMPAGLVRGVRTASDFLMALQLTGAAKKDVLANMQVRLPVVVIGGGLTAIDTATEALAYYPRQVETFLGRYEQLRAQLGERQLRSNWDARENAIADEFILHAREFRAERAAAVVAGRRPALAKILQKCGGSTIVYRKRLVDSPAYTLNHEEVEKALEEGIVFAERLSPVDIEVDEFRDCAALKVSEMALDDDHRWHAGATRSIPAKSVFMAAGTKPNTVLAGELSELSLAADGHFVPCDKNGKVMPISKEGPKTPSPNFLLHRDSTGRSISHFGDLHPNFAGNVVKAMASAKRGVSAITVALNDLPRKTREADEIFFDGLRGRLHSVVHAVNRLTPSIVEVVIHSPQAAEKFRPGQFFRLQNFETHARTVRATRLAMEGLAMTGAWVDRDKGLVAVIVLEVGGSSDLCAGLRPGEPVILMGPTGEPTFIPKGETIVLVGGGLGNAVLFSIGRACRESGSRVLYFAGYKRCSDRYKVSEIEAAADQIVWCCDENPGFEPGRPGDLSFVGNIVQGMEAYACGELGPQNVPMNDARRVIAIGSDAMMKAVALARRAQLKDALNPKHVAIGSINSPMQCMMKEICAQCLQTHRDPNTGEISHVFSCANQDQELDFMDWRMLNERLSQNSVQEKLVRQWLASLDEDVTGV